jgi:tetratricopeptide (TPR) repeat protein
VKIADPAPAAGSPATEKFLREASAHFRAKEYYEAAVKFRLAALSSPEIPGPLFALGQSLVAMEQDAYAAKVLRRAIEMSPKMLEETGDISGVWESPQEFDRVMKALEARSAESPVDGDARFLLSAERYFAGDVRCREGLDVLHQARPMDAAVEHLRAAASRRFKSPDELPAIEKK